MNVSLCCLGLVMIVLYFTTCLFIRESNKHIAELKKELDDAMACINCHQKAMQLMDDGIAKNEKELNDIKKNFASLDKGLDLTLTSHLKGIEGSLKGMLDILEQEHTEALERAQNASERQIKAFCEDGDTSEDSGDDDEPYADIPGDLDEGFEWEESATDEQREALEHAEKISKSKHDIPSYHWVFPHDDYGENWPVLGERRLVIGRERKTGEIVSGVGTWAGIKYDMEDGYKLDKIYADIKLPSPSDVMNEVLDIRFKEG